MATFETQAYHVDFVMHTLGWKAFQDLCAQVMEEELQNTVSASLWSNEICVGTNLGGIHCGSPGRRRVQARGESTEASLGDHQTLRRLHQRVQHENRRDPILLHGLPRRDCLQSVRPSRPAVRNLVVVGGVSACPRLCLRNSVRNLSRIRGAEPPNPAGSSAARRTLGRFFWGCC
ncbi:hypothetical protein D3C71_1498850 [compost metagenome]